MLLLFLPSKASVYDEGQYIKGFSGENSQAAAWCVIARPFLYVLRTLKTE